MMRADVTGLLHPWNYSRGNIRSNINQRQLNLITQTPELIPGQKNRIFLQIIIFADKPQLQRVSITQLNRYTIMSHAHSKIWIHSVWGTKHRTSIILPRFEDDIFDFMHKQFMLINCKASIINGMPDHIHCLFRLSRSKSISQVMKQVKGSTSRFINDQCHIKDNFEWQVGYGAFSVSESVFPTTYNYIAFQKQHHKKITFPEEYDQLTNQNGLIISSF